MNNITLSAVLDAKGSGTCPPSEVLDAIAEAKLSGGYGKRNALCGECFTRKSVVGACACDAQ